MINRSVLAVGINTPVEEKIIIQEKLKLKDITLDTASIKDIVFEIIDGKISVDIKGKVKSKEKFMIMDVLDKINANIIT